MMTNGHLTTYSASSFWVSVVSIGIRHFSAIESCVGVVSGDGHRFDLFRLIRSLFQHHGTLGFVGLGRSITVMRRGSITENPKLEWFWRKNSNGRHTYHVGAAHKLGPEENMERVHDKRAREQERMERVHGSLV